MKKKNKGIMLTLLFFAISNCIAVADNTIDTTSVDDRYVVLEAISLNFMRSEADREYLFVDKILNQIEQNADDPEELERIVTLWRKIYPKNTEDRRDIEFIDTLFKDLQKYPNGKLFYYTFKHLNYEDTGLCIVADNKALKRYVAASGIDHTEEGYTEIPTTIEPRENKK